MIGIATALAPLAVLVLSTAPPEGAAAPVAEAPADIDMRIDQALEIFHSKRFGPAAQKLFAAWKALPDTDLRRDTVQFYLAVSLDELGFSQVAGEMFVELITARRAPELMAPALQRMDALVRKSRLDEDRLVNEVLYSGQFGELGDDAADFVEYHQALGDLRRGFTAWGTKRMETLAQVERYWGWKARFALGVERLAKGNVEGAEKLFRAILDATDTQGAKAAPADVRNDARLALAREQYERKEWESAWKLYADVDSPLPMQDVVLLEKAWDRVAANDPRRALGMVVGLGAPVYRRLFAPERSLINAMALRQLCQFRSAHIAVRDFRRNYGGLLKKIRAREPVTEDGVVKESLERNFRMLPAVRWNGVLLTEKARLGDLDDEKLEKHLAGIYDAKLARVRWELTRGMEKAAERIAEELLRIDEQMSILDYEIGVGLFKSAEAKVSAQAGGVVDATRMPYGSDNAYFRFGGEYWSDEINDFQVIAEDRCLK